jgi:hypothetical protein
VLTGRFEDHHAELLTLMLETADHLTAQIDKLTARIEQLLADASGDGPHPGGGAPRPDGSPHARAAAARFPGGLPVLAERLDAIPGIGPTTAQVILVSAHFAVRRQEHQRYQQAAVPGCGACSARPRWPPQRPTLSSAPATGAWSNAAATNKALVAVARLILVIVWH